MTHTKSRLTLASLMLASAIGLAGCGGGGGNDGYYPIATAPPPAAPAQPPVAAADPYDTFVAFVKDMVGSLLDAADPVDVAAFDPPPTSETKDPIPTE